MRWRRCSTLPRRRVGGPRSPSWRSRVFVWANARSALERRVRPLHPCLQVGHPGGRVRWAEEGGGQPRRAAVAAAPPHPGRVALDVPARRARIWSSRRGAARPWARRASEGRSRWRRRLLGWRARSASARTRSSRVRDRPRLGGLNATTLARILGHTDASFTLRTYCSDQRSVEDVAADVLRASAV